MPAYQTLGKHSPSRSQYKIGTQVAALATLVISSKRSPAAASEDSHSGGGTEELQTRLVAHVEPMHLHNIDLSMI